MPSKVSAQATLGGRQTSTDAVRCETADAAIDHAERLSRSPGYIGAWAFMAIGNPTYGFEIDEVLHRFGSFPDYRV